MKSTTRKILKSIFPESFWKRAFRTSSQLVSSDYLARHGFSSMWWSLQNLKKLGYQPDIIVDVGAFAGEWTKRAMTIFEDKYFLMVEPQPDKQTLLSQLEKKYKNVMFAPFVVAATDDQNVEFTIQKTGSSVYEQTFEGRASKQKVTLQTKMLDSIVQEKKLTGEFLLKLDVQGYEIEVMKGAKHLLDHTNVVLLESSLLNYNRNAPLIDEIFKYMKQQGFILFDVAELNRKDDDNVLSQADLIFCRHDWQIRQKSNFI